LVNAIKVLQVIIAALMH